MVGRKKKEGQMEERKERGKEGGNVRQKEIKMKETRRKGRTEGR